MSIIDNKMSKMTIKSWIATVIVVCGILYNINRIINDDNYYIGTIKGQKVGNPYQKSSSTKTIDIVWQTFTIVVFGSVIITLLRDKVE